MIHTETVISTHKLLVISDFEKLNHIRHAILHQELLQMVSIGGLLGALNHSSEAAIVASYPI